MIGDAFALFIIWHWIHRQLTLMRPFEEQLRRANHKKLRLARQDEKLWLEFCNVVQTMEIFPIALLSTGLKASPRLRNIYFTRESIRKGNPQLKEVPEKHTDAEKRVDLLFHAIINDERRELHTLNHLVQEAQHMLDTDPEANILIDSWLSSIFADLAMLSELNTRVECLDPWSTGWKRCDLLHSKAALKPMEDILALETKLRTGLSKAFSNGQMLDEFHAIDILLDGKFEYPASKRQTEENVEKMRFTENLLDGVWEEIERCVLETTNISITKVIKNRLFEPRMKFRTLDYMPPLLTPTKAPVLVERSINVPRFGEGTSTTNVATPVKEKIKVKTRGVADSLTQAEDKGSSSNVPDTPSPVATVKVPKRAYKVLAALFPPPGAASHQRTEIAWEDLLQAMHAIGFHPMKLYGSVWIFMPRNNDGKMERRGGGQVIMSGECKVEAKRSIQFHEPKEVRKGSKISANMVRTFGRRMKHAFGWWDGMFVCE